MLPRWRAVYGGNTYSTKDTSLETKTEAPPSNWLLVTMNAIAKNENLEVWMNMPPPEGERRGAQLQFGRSAS